MPATIDLEFQGRRGVIATAVVPVAGGVVLVDPGPSSCLAALEGGLRALNHSFDDIRAIFLTHIHLDHAGVTGTLVRRVPGLPVYVHDVGARHLVSPERLIASATQLHGSAMDRLWGEFLPVPAASLKSLGGGEAIEVGGRRFDVAYTPGHAKHHVSYLDTVDGTAYVGDTVGVRGGPGYVMAATPPPDIDLEQWEDSLVRLEVWKPAQLFLTHFGLGEAPTTHLALFRESLARAAHAVKDSLGQPGADDEKIARWKEWLGAELRATMSEERALAAEAAAPLGLLWLGLARYWRKRADSSSPPPSEPGRSS